MGVSSLLGQLIDSSIAVEFLLRKEAPPNVLGCAVSRHPAEGEFDIWPDRAPLPDGPGAAAEDLPEVGPLGCKKATATSAPDSATAKALFYVLAVEREVGRKGRPPYRQAQKEQLSLRH